MKKLLHIIATPRAEESRTLKVSEAFLDSVTKKYPDCKIETLNVATENLPLLTVKRITGKYTLLSGKDLSDDLKGSPHGEAVGKAAGFRGNDKASK